MTPIEKACQCPNTSRFFNSFHLTYNTDQRIRSIAHLNVHPGAELFSFIDVPSAPPQSFEQLRYSGLLSPDFHAASGYFALNGV